MTLAECIGRELVLFMRSGEPVRGRLTSVDRESSHPLTVEGTQWPPFTRHVAATAVESFEIIEPIE